MRQRATVIPTAITLVTMALLPGTSYAQERPALFANTDVLQVTTNHCHNMAKLTFIQFGAGPIFENGGLSAAGLGAGGTVAVYCLPEGNPNQSRLVVEAATATAAQGQDLLNRFFTQLKANVNVQD